MTVDQIKKLINGRVLTKVYNSDAELTSAFSSDMMSHVLAYANNKSILITAMYNAQVIRTADLLGIVCIIFIGRNDPDASLVSFADSLGITVIRSEYSMYTTCGLLFSNGLKGNCPDEQK